MEDIRYTCLDFLKERHIEWLRLNQMNNKIIEGSGIITNANIRGVNILDDQGKTTSFTTAEMILYAKEPCIRALMTRCLEGPTNQKLLYDRTPYDLYKLVDPRTTSLRYIGISANVIARYKQHLHCNNPHDVWIPELLKEKLLPVLEIFGHVIGKYAALIQETYWIHYYLQNGADLTNGENIHYVEEEL